MAPPSLTGNNPIQCLERFFLQLGTCQHQAGPLTVTADTQDLGALGSLRGRFLCICNKNHEFVDNLHVWGTGDKMEDINSAKYLDFAVHDGKHPLI